jgi:AmmeMemoRadiSam system protein A
MSEAGERGPVLIAIAREAIERVDEIAVEARWAALWLRQPGATFVTLKIEGELRGCIGSLEARRPVGEDVARNARGAAYRDPRFPPVSAGEVPRLQVEVSLLSAREPLAVSDERDALAKLRPGIDGLLLEYGDLCSTFLPQVWESLPEPAEFLGELKRKAGLPRAFWHPAVRLSRYTVEKFR